MRKGACATIAKGARSLLKVHTIPRAKELDCCRAREPSECGRRPTRQETQEVRVAFEELTVEVVVDAYAAGVSIGTLAMVDAKATVHVVPERAIVDAVPQMALETVDVWVETMPCDDPAMEDSPVFATRALEQQRNRQETIPGEPTAGKAPGAGVDAVTTDRVEARAKTLFHVHQHRQRERCQLVVTVEHADPLPASLVEAAVARGRDTVIRSLANVAYADIIERRDDVARVVGGCAVDDHELPIRVRLSEDATQRSRQSVRTIVGGHHQRDHERALVQRTA
jgi:hypothetical protein